MKEVYVIFICTFDPFDKGQYRYLFQSVNPENPQMKLDDKVTTIFFNTTSVRDDIPVTTRLLFEYINTGKPCNEITSKLHNAVKKARLREDWRNEYMLSIVHDMDVRNEGRAEGRAEMQAIIDEKDARIKELEAELSKTKLKKWLRRLKKIFKLSDN